MTDKEFTLRKFGIIHKLKFVTRNGVTNIFLNDEWVGKVEKITEIEPICVNGNCPIELCRLCQMSRRNLPWWF